MKFWDREKEVAYLKRYLQSEPNAILFVYGPKSSGKSTLLAKVVDEIRKEKRAGFLRSWRVYWFDLRGALISGYQSVIDLFFMEEESEALREIERSFEAGIRGFFKVKRAVKEEFVQKRADPFRYMEAVLKKVKKNMIVFDEIQRFKEVYINGERSVVDALFNFFVRITKVLHLSHVLVMTSDTFFIEEVYTSSALKNTSEFYLVDYFDDETSLRILIDEGLSEEDARYVVENVGGVPWMMERILANGDVREKVEELAMIYKSRLREILGKLYEVDESLQRECKEFLKRFLGEGTADLEGKDRKCVKVFVENEVLFYDPVKGCVRFQTHLDERAARELLA